MPLTKASNNIREPWKNKNHKQYQKVKREEKRKKPVIKRGRKREIVGPTGSPSAEPEVVGERLREGDTKCISEQEEIKLSSPLKWSPTSHMVRYLKRPNPT